MEGLTRLVSESLARHGFDRPLDYRRLHWSRWFRCESHHSLLLVPSKPGVFALAEEIMDFSPAVLGGMLKTYVGTAGAGCPAEQSPAESVWDRVSDPVRPSAARLDPASSTAVPARRMLAVSRFFEDDDMAFVLDRMLAAHHPMRARLTSGRYFVRFVVIEEESQRRSIGNALNQWIANSSEKASSIGSDFASSLELTPATEYVPQANETQASLFEEAGVELTLLSATVGSAAQPKQPPNPSAKSPVQATAPQLESGAATNIHSPSPFPSGF
jgi:hypothetical protein